MFSDPTQIPPDSNYLPFIWTYAVEEDGTKKARESCNELSRIKETVALEEIYAASLDQTASKLFWNISLKKTHGDRSKCIQRICRSTRS